MTAGQMEAILKPLIDKEGVGGVVEVLADICSEKAEHIRANWQDDVLANLWQKNADKLYALKLA